jgi:hypothetical protein
MYTIKKMVFYSAFTMINVIALIFIGMSFLGSASAGGFEGAVQYSNLELFLRKFVFILIISSFFSFCSLLLGFLSRNALEISRQGLKRIFAGELLLFISFYFIAYFYVYVM